MMNLGATTASPALPPLLHASPAPQRFPEPGDAVSMGVVRLVVTGAMLRGADVPELLAAAGLSPDALADADAYLPTSAMCRLFAAAERLTGDDSLGLHLAELVLEVPASDTLGYACRSSPTLGEALRRLTRYHRLIHGAADFRLEANEDTARLVHRRPPGAVTPSRHAVEGILASIFLRVRKHTGPALTLRHVGFAHARPADTSEHDRLFAAPVLFDQPFDSLVFDRALLDLPNPHADEALARVLDRFLEQTGVCATTPLRFADQVRQRIAEQLKGQCPPVEAIAARMHMSPRTLQRRLRDEGTTYLELLNDVRRELALRHVQEGRESISEIAFLLGFSEVSTFHRAFKRWCGRTPAEVRRHRAPGM
ncbi:MAG TPA: AraC family transcriptional regulator [Myxococcaceae bacterium]|nr:AraC family transcriptional regulator [Myxococcaceae bacterium]